MAAMLSAHVRAASSCVTCASARARAGAGARAARGSACTSQPKPRSVRIASSMRPCAARYLGDSGMNAFRKISTSPVGRFRNHRMRQLQIGSSHAAQPLAAR